MDIPVRTRLRLGSGDIFAVISDGVFEAADPEGRPFGVDGVTAVLHAQRRASPQAMLDALRSAIAIHTGGLAAQDDRTAIIIKCDGG